MTRLPWTRAVQCTSQEQIGDFRCSRASVTDWLHQKAIASRPHVTTVLYLDDHESVIAFAATTTVVVDVRGGTSAQRFGQRDGQSVGFFLAQMGVREDRAGEGIGSAVLRHTMARAVRSYEEAPFSLFVVDAADETLVEYYRRRGLRPLNNQLRLVAPMHKLAKKLSAASDLD